MYAGIGLFMTVKLMLVEDVSKPKNPFELCGESEPFPLEPKPFTREDWTDICDQINSWVEPIRANWLCPKCSDLVTTTDGKGTCFSCLSCWVVRPALTLVKE
jgi:hypothetical protein